MSGSTIEASAVFEGKRQTAARIGHGAARQAASAEAVCLRSQEGQASENEGFRSRDGRLQKTKVSVHWMAGFRKRRFPFTGWAGFKKRKLPRWTVSFG